MKRGKQRGENQQNKGNSVLGTDIQQTLPVTVRTRAANEGLSHGCP